MKYRLDHDFHIHSKLSPCSNDPEETPEAILRSAVANGYRDIVLTDHFWDADVPCASGTWKGYDYISQSLPLPEAPGTRFHFGCEADMDRYSVVGIHPKNAEKFDFIIVPINHLHCPWAKVQRNGVDKKEQANILAQRFWNLLRQDLPFHKMGLAHITWDGVAGGEPGTVWQDHIDILNYVPDERWRLLFSEAAERGIGIELNVNTKRYVGEEQQTAMLRPYRIAKECGCKFYFGSDAHHPAELENLRENAAFLIDRLDLTENDKFRPFG